MSDRDIRIVAYPEVRALVERDAGARRLALLDPRGQEDFDAGHLPGARRQGTLPHDGKLDRDILSARDVIVYGENPASTLGRGMTKRLMDLGVSNVRFYAGGLEEWKRMQGPIERSAEDVKGSP